MDATIFQFQQEQHLGHLQEVRAERAEVRQAVELPVLQHHRGLRQRQVPALPRELQEVRRSEVMWSVQAEVRVRQGIHFNEISLRQQYLPWVELSLNFGFDSSTS